MKIALPISPDDVQAQQLRDDPTFARSYLNESLENIDAEGGIAAFLLSLRHVIDARGGIRPIAEKTGLSRETLYRMLSATGNPMLKNLVAVMDAAGVPLSGLHLEPGTVVRNTKTIPHSADRK